VGRKQDVPLDDKDEFEREDPIWRFSDLVNRTSERLEGYLAEINAGGVCFMTDDPKTTEANWKREIARILAWRKQNASR
jgi:hypothetical protein